MKKATRRYNSIAFKLAVIFIIAVLTQGLVMAAFLVGGGVLSETKINAYNHFSTQVSNRKSGLENEIKDVWTNFEGYTEKISRNSTVYRDTTPEDQQTSEAILSDVAPILIDALRATRTTGVFLILDDNEGTDDSHSALYIRNMDPDKMGTDNFSFTMMVGDLDIARQFKISTNENWTFDLKLNEGNKGFYEKPYSNMAVAADKKLLGYWSPPFKLSENDEEIITYSLPISDQNGDPIGVFGIEISVNHLYKFLPKGDLEGKTSFGYIIGMRTSKDGGIYPIVSRGALQGRMLNLEEPLALNIKNEKFTVCEITNSNSNDAMYSCIKKMGLYYNNTPYFNEEWYLIGLIEKSSLLAFPIKMRNILLISLSVTVIIGIIAAVLASRNFSRPIVELAEKVKNLSETYPDSLENIGLKEIDELSHAIVSVQRKMFNLNDELKYERDRDPLTGIRNRNAFNRSVEYYNREISRFEKIAMGIFDLNGLKYINDNFGHGSGDEYLCEAVKAICENFKDCPVFRIGGDEFAVIITNLGREEIEQRKEKLSKPKLQVEGVDTSKIGIAFGYAFYEAGADINLEHVLMRADENMYINKKTMKGL